MSTFRSSLSIALARFGYRACRLDVFGKWAWLQQANKWSIEQREAWRLERLGDLLEFAWNNVPFYREYWGDHGVQYRRPRHLDDLQHYPVLTKDVFRSSSRRICPTSLDHIRHMDRCTGGSTSVPVHYLLDLEQWTFMEAFHLWGWSQLGYKFGDAVGVIAGGSLVPEKMEWKSRIRSYAQRRLFLYGLAMDKDLARDYHRQLTIYGAEFLYGYPSILYLFAKFLAEERLSLPRLRGIVTTAEMLLPHYRQGIEKWLGCPVFNNYGSNDGGVESYECQLHQGFHYNDLQSILEVRGTDAQAGASPLLITNLWNRSTPFIRYENGDLVQLGDRCQCGSPFPIISSVAGRTADILTFSNGLSVSGPALTLIFGEMEIDGWQIVQTGGNSLEVRICTAGDIRQDYLNKIHRVLEFHLRGEIQVAVRKVAQLELTKGGKLKPIWTEGDAIRNGSAAPETAASRMV